MEYYPTTKKNEILINGTTWINFRNIMPVSKAHMLHNSIYMKDPNRKGIRKGFLETEHTAKNGKGN